MRLLFDIGPNQIRVQSAYNPTVATLFRLRGGKWHPSTSSWVLPNSPAALGTLDECYGLSQEQVTVLIPLDHTLLEQRDGVLAVGGYPLARWNGPGLPVTLCHGVGVYEGEMMPGCGSRSRPVIRAHRGTVLQARVAADFATRHRLRVREGEEVYA